MNLSQASPLTQTLLAGGAACLLSTAVTPLIRRFAVGAGCVSRPAGDRWGRRVVPRLGGIPIGLVFLACVAWAAFSDLRMIGLLLAGALILVTGLVDDFKRIHPNSKLIAQILAGCIVVLSGIQADLPNSWLAVPLTIGWLVLVMNAFNLMDNMDGLSAGIGAIAAFFCAWQALQTGQQQVAILAGALAGATLGFLRYNLPPARIFMGDTGSQVLGLGLGTLALLQTWHHGARLLGMLALPTLLLAVPIFDTLFVMIERLMHGRHPFQGGTDHVSHRLGVLGLSPRQVVFTLCALAAAFGALSIALAGQAPLAITGALLLALGGLLLLGAYLAKVRVYAGPLPSDPAVAARTTWIDTMLMHKRRILEVLVDFAFVCGCYVLAHFLRFEGYLSPDLEELLLKSLPWVIVVKMSCFFACGLYRGVWRYMGVPELVDILRAIVLGSVLSALAVLYLWRFEGYSRAVFIIDGTLLFLAVSGARLAEPMLNEWINSSVQRTRQVLIIGAGDTGELLLQQFKLDRQGRRRVAAFLDDDPLKQGNRIHGIPIAGSRRELGRVVQEMEIQEVFIAIRRPPEDLVRQVQSYCEENGLLWTVVTSLTPSEPAPRATA